MEPRKRQHDEDKGVENSKKRALIGPNGGPYANGVSESDEPTDIGKLEAFRKQAIFRRMKHYSREHERGQARIAELEQRKNTCEAGLAAMSACWAQLVQAIRLLARPEELDPIDTDTNDLFDLTKRLSSDSSPELVNELRDKLEVTQTFVTKLARSSPVNQLDILHDTTYRKFQEAQTECVALQSEMAVLRAKLCEVESEKESYHAQLVAAEVRVDRLQSSTVISTESHRKRDDSEGGTQEAEDSQRKSPSSPAHDRPNGTGFHPPESDELKDLVKLRDEQIQALDHENADLRREVDRLNIELKAPSESFVIESPYYKALQEQASRFSRSLQDNAAEMSRLYDELTQLRESQSQIQHHAEEAAAKPIVNYKEALKKREDENARLRQQRDQQLAELQERKQKESAKWASTREMKALAESRSERISALQSELNRLRARLAADAGDGDFLSFILKVSPEDVAYVDDLKKRLKAAEGRVAALDECYSRLEKEYPDVAQHMRAEANARQQLAEVVQELKRFQETYGDLSSLPPEIGTLGEQLLQKDDELRKLRLLDSQRDQAESSLYTEVEKLSAAWEALDRQVKDKVFQLIDNDERLTKLSLEKAKADNKFFSVVREKEAIEVERKNIARNLEKQTKVLDKLTETEKSLTAQINNLEKELLLTRRVQSQIKTDCDVAQRDVIEWKYRAEDEAKRVSKILNVVHDKEKIIDRYKADARGGEETLTRAKKETERINSMLEALRRSEAQGGVSDEDGYRKLLKCPTCQIDFRDATITKCMHTFCRRCLDKRISSRQRRCPSCSLPFGQADVQTIYIQC